MATLAFYGAFQLLCGAIAACDSVRGEFMRRNSTSTDCVLETDTDGRGARVVPDQLPMLRKCARNCMPRQSCLHAVSYVSEENTPQPGSRLPFSIRPRVPVVWMRHALRREAV
jgi:hypothetical protein